MEDVMALTDKGFVPDRIEGEWARCMSAGSRCDMTVLEAGGNSRPCSSQIQIGAPLWVERHVYDSPLHAHKSYAICKCETCRLLEIAREWADAGEVPTYKLAMGSTKAIAGKHLLTPEQYATAKRFSVQLLDAETKPDVPAPPPPEPPKDPAPLQAREVRKVRATRESGGERGGLAG